MEVLGWCKLMNTRLYLEQNPEGAHALAGRLAILKQESKTVVQMRRRLLRSAYIAALHIKNLKETFNQNDATDAVRKACDGLAQDLYRILLPAMGASARLGSYGIERAEIDRAAAGATAIRAKHTRVIGALIRSFPAREFAGRDLKARCLDAAAGFAESIADAAASALVLGGPSASARTVEEYAAFGLRDKPRSRDAVDRLPDNPGWQAELLTISELNYAYNAGTRTSGEASGIYAGSRWMLSPLHKEIDICDDYANEDKFGLGAGVFPSGQEPCYPHPNCRCWLAPVFGNAKERG